MSSGPGSGSRITGSECRKFVPNIFNKSKCSSCFKQKEEHSAEALESNRATRKISKCGYLFVAPGWDFSNPLNRTKRWQRRWFVLYDDGELTYSVDEHPETVPQARIDMTRVLEVAAAEDVTGHPYSLAITSSEGVTFIKGTCREETRWWAEVLQVYSRNKGRHKRNATFPGGQTTILQIAPAARSNTPNLPRPRFNSCRSESSISWIPDTKRSELRPVTVLPGNSCGEETDILQKNGMVPLHLPSVSVCDPTSHLGSTSVAAHSSAKDGINLQKPPIALTIDGREYRDHPASSASPPTRDKLRAEDKARRRLNQQCESMKNASLSSIEKLDDGTCRRILLKHEKEREGKLRDIAASLTQPRARKNKSRSGEPTRDVVDSTGPVIHDKLIRGDPDGCVLDISGIRYSPTSELRVDLPAEDLLNIKKGWLMKQGLDKEWTKHWFVLRGCGLLYYRDPSAEDKGFMDGVIDLNTIATVSQIQVARNYGFQAMSWDGRNITVLSAVTSGIRSSWMAAIQRAANLSGPNNTPELSDVSKECQQEMNSQPTSPRLADRDRECISLIPLTPRPALHSSDEEYRTASEGGRRESGDWTEISSSPPLSHRGIWTPNAKSNNWTETTKHEWSELPPSPPLTRTALSRVKARSRSCSRNRVYKRSRSSPPSSRRSTLDSVKSDDLAMVGCQVTEDTEQSINHLTGSVDDDILTVDLFREELPVIEKSTNENQYFHENSLLAVAQRQENEIEKLKSLLNTARTEIANSEKELDALRQERAEAIMRERQANDLLNAMQKNEHQRHKDIKDLDKIKKFYNREKENMECKLLETEGILKDKTERCEVLVNKLSSSQMTVDRMQKEIASLTDKLTQGIDENERLYTRVRELEGKCSLSSSRERGRSFDSLSDLTNIDLDLDLNVLDKERVMEEYDELRSRFEKAVLEIRAMRKELREAHAEQDVLELEIYAHKQEVARIYEANQAQLQLMAARIQDLTSKLAGSEKQVRILKQRLTKLEARDKRRSLSLKGRESFQIAQEVEEKIIDLEKKISAIQASKDMKSKPYIERKQTDLAIKEDLKKEHRNVPKTSRVRRKSLDSATSSEPMKVLIRLSTLESKISNMGMEGNAKEESEFSVVNVNSSNEFSDKLLCRLQNLEKSVAKSKICLEKYLDQVIAVGGTDKYLLELHDILNSCTGCSKKQQQIDLQINESVGVIVSKLEKLLRNKMSELLEKRENLDRLNQLNDQEKLKLIAERIAFEFVILKQIKCAMEKTYERSSVLKELVETSQLISNLKCKINATKPKMYQNMNYIQYLTRVLANKLVLLGSVSKKSFDKSSTEISAARADSLKFLLQKQKEINQIVNKYKNEKIENLAKALAIETLSLSSEPKEISKHIESLTKASNNKLVEDKRIREAWILAQETISKELIQVEISHFIMNCGQIYEENISSISDTCLNFDTSYNISLESWVDKAKSMLREQMEYSMQELTCAYEQSLERMKNDKLNVSEMKYNSKELLSDYADIIAHKAVIDARISLLQDGSQELLLFPGKTFVTSLLHHEDILNSLLEENQVFESNPINDAEFVYLFQHFAKIGQNEISPYSQLTEEQSKTLTEVFNCLSEEINSLKESIKNISNGNLDTVDWEERTNTSALTDCKSIFDKFLQLSEKVKKLSQLTNNIRCLNCSQLQDKLQHLKEDHKKELQELCRNQEKDLMDIKGEWDNQRNFLTSQYEIEAAGLRERAKKLEHKLNAMDSEHSAHVNELRAAYQRSISADLDTDSETRKRYKEEIKQLRGLCEKGLLAMENSHRRIIADMEEKHRQELETLKIEKDQALSEETQATLAALDAMRKAHENEVQKEITKFKQEFLKQMQARQDIGALHKDHEDEMEEIKREILSLSAKYSSKCVETAALEEKVGVMSKQLSQAQQRIIHLDAKNKQLRRNFSLETKDVNINNSVLVSRGSDKEAAKKKDDSQRLQQHLKHGDIMLPDTANLSSHTPTLSYSPVYSQRNP